MTSSTRAPWGKFVTIGLLNTAQQIPLTLAGILVPTVYRTLGLPLDRFALFSIPIGVSALRFLWAPVLDRYGSTRFGFRKSWILPCTIAGSAIYVWMATRAPSLEGFGILLGQLVLMQLVMSTQDMAVDAYTVESFEKSERGLGASIRAVFSEGGQLAAIAGLMVVYQSYGWSTAISTAAGLLVALTLPALIRPEAPPTESLLTHRHRSARDRLRDFLARSENRRILLVIVVSSFVTGLAPAMIGAFLVDKGLEVGEIGVVLGLASTAGAVVANTTYGAWILHRFGPKTMARLLLVLVPLGLVPMVLLARAAEPTSAHVAAAIVASTLLTAPADVVVFAARLGWTSPSQVGTDFGIGASAYVLGRSFLATAVAGPLAALAGWSGYFLLIGAFSVVSLALFLALFDGIERDVAAHARPVVPPSSEEELP